MATILELAREVRHRIVNRSTGRLELIYSDRVRSIDFSGGTIVSGRDVLVPCFDEAPLETSFRSMKIPSPTELQDGAALFTKAMDSMDDRALWRVWEPYRNWTVLLPEDLRFHKTQVLSHLQGDGKRPRHMLDLAVSGTLTLRPPVAKTIDEEMRQIQAATARGDYWQVLNIARSASSEVVKKAYRKRVRQFHPDRWYSVEDRNLKSRVEGAFRDVYHCYEQVLRALPRGRSSVATALSGENIPSILARAEWGRLPIPLRRAVASDSPITPFESAPRLAQLRSIRKNDRCRRQELVPSDFRE